MLIRNWCGCLYRLRNLKKLVHAVIIISIIIGICIFSFAREDFKKNVVTFESLSEETRNKNHNISPVQSVYTTSTKPQNVIITSPPSKAKLARAKPAYTSYELGSVFKKKTCDQVLGSVAILQYADHSYAKSVVWNAMQSLKCYTKMTGYHLYQFDEDFPPEMINTCKWLTHVFARRHCLTAQLLMLYDYILFIDGDSGVINPYHCIEEYINPDVDFMLLLRDTTGEVQAGQYMVKNTTFSRNFLMQWAELTHTTYPEDQSALHKVLTLKVLNTEERDKCDSLLVPHIHKKKPHPYWRWVECMVKCLRQRKAKETGNRVQIAARTQGFLRDTWPTDYKWSRTDFILHVWKHEHDAYLTRKMLAEDCQGDEWNIPYKRKYIVDEKTLHQAWIKIEGENPRDRKGYARLVDFTKCWPNCPHLIV